MNKLYNLTDEIILQHLDEDLKEKLSNIYYLEEFCEQFKKYNNDTKTLVEETFDYLKEANICLTKKDALSKLKEISQNIINSLNKIESEEEEDEEEKNEESEDFSELNDLDGNDGKEVEGLCEMCFSSRHLTLHHAIPKLMIKRLKRKKKKAPVIYLKLCSSCHSHLHKTFPHAILAKKYYEINAILECEELQMYIADKRRYVEHTERNR